MECHLSSRNTSYDAVIIGAGASGLVCAAEMAKRGLRTLLVEQNKKSGRKLYATGNGRCNLANAVLSDSAYYGNSFAASVVTEGAAEEMKRGLEEVGILLTGRGDYLYPSSLQASSVVWALTDAASMAGTEFLYDTKVCRIERRKCENAEGYGCTYLLHTSDGGVIRTERLVLAMGSPAAPKLGAAPADAIYGLLKDLGLPFRAFEPALCPLETKEDLSSLAGVRTHARLTFGDESEEGELQLTEYGISGIVTFNLSTVMSVGDQIEIDLLPDHSEGELLSFIRKQKQERRLMGVLNCILHEKLCGYFLEECLGADSRKSVAASFSEKELGKLLHGMKHWKVTVSGKRGDMGQACAGGVLTTVMDPKDFTVRGDGGEYPALPGLAVTGELLDVVGRCGGYNLMFAMISGRKAGRSL